MSSSMLKYLIAAESLCDDENGVSLTALALKTGVTKVSAYRAVDRLETGGYMVRDGKKKIFLTRKGIESLRTYMREVYVLRDVFMKICKLPRYAAYHEALKAVGALSGKSLEALTDFFEKNVIKTAG